MWTVTAGFTNHHPLHILGRESMTDVHKLTTIFDEFIIDAKSEDTDDDTDNDLMDNPIFDLNLGGVVSSLFIWASGSTRPTLASGAFRTFATSLFIWASASTKST